MKLISFLTKGDSRYGIAKNHGVIDLCARLGSKFPTLRDLLAAGATDQAESIARAAPPDYSLDEIVFLPPVPNPEKIICIGVNYANRNAEYKDNSDLPKYPSVFMRAPGSLVGHNSKIIRPPESQQLDYEGEIAIVIGASGRRIPEARARQHIAGLTIMNEGTIRDWLRHGKFNVTQGKNFDASGAMGPWLVTADEFRDFTALTVSTFVNGERRQHDTTANLMFGFAELIAYISIFTTLKPGDVISTGTPTGSGVRSTPPVWLKPGDVVRVEAPGIGILSNKVMDEK